MPFKITVGPKIDGVFDEMLSADRRAKRYDKEFLDEETQEMLTSPRYALPAGSSESDFDVVDLTEVEAQEVATRLAARRSTASKQYYGEVSVWNEEVDGPWVEA